MATIRRCVIVVVYDGFYFGSLSRCRQRSQRKLRNRKKWKAKRGRPSCVLALLFAFLCVLSWQISEDENVSISMFIPPSRFRIDCLL